MAKIGCRDCKKCSRSTIGKIVGGTVRGSLAFSTAGVSSIAVGTARLGNAKCGQCGHLAKVHKGGDLSR
jgi:hypothetical protein